MGFWNLKFGRGSFENCIRPFKMHQKWVQMIPDTISDIFQPINDFFYGLDVEIRPKLTPTSCLSTCGGVIYVTVGALAKTRTVWRNMPE